MADESTPTGEDSGEQVAALTPAADETPGAEALGDPGKQALDRMKAERNDASKRAKALEKQLADLQAASMSETEKQITEAEKRGRTNAAADFGKRLARTQFDAAAGRRNADFDTAPVFDYLDLSRFVGEDGEPDTKAIAAAVERLIPAPPTGPPSFDGGARNAAPAGADMNKLMRGALGRT